MAFGTTSLEAWGGERMADWGANPVLPGYTGNDPANPSRPGIDEILDEIQRFSSLVGQVGQGIVLRDYANGLEPTISGANVAVATGGCLLDGQIHLNDASVNVAFSGSDVSDTYYIYVTHTLTSGSYVPTLAKVRDGFWSGIDPYVRLCSVDWNGSTLSALTDLRANHYVPMEGDVALLSGSTFSGAVGVTRGLLVMARDTGYGPPTSGTYATGAHWWDLAGAHWYCTAGGAPGTWVQLTPGALSSAPAAGSFNGGAVLAGYRYYDTTDNIMWTSWHDSGSHYRWQSADLLETPMGVSREERTSVGSGQSPFRSFWPSSYDIRLVKFSVGIEGSGSFDVSNYWTIALQKWIPSSLTAIDSTDQTATTYRIWDVSPSGTTGHIAVSSFRVANLMVTATGSPGTIYLEFPKYSYRWVKA